MNKLIALSFLLLCACGSIKNTTERPTNDLPIWVKESPKIEGYYTGVGVADKSTFPQTYIQVAQKNALRSLSEKIEIEIERGSIFSQMKKENNFGDKYKTYLRENAKTYLESYELNGSFSQKNEYWVYYKLNINKHNEIQKARKEEAMDEAKKYLEKASNTSNTVNERYSYYVKGLDVLKPFLNKKLYTKINDSNILLASKIIASFRAFVDDFKIQSLGKKIKVMVGDEVGNIKMGVQFKKEWQKNIPLFTSSKSFDVVNFSKLTDKEGVFISNIPKITSTEPTQKIEVGINFNDWISSYTSDDFIKKLIQSIETHQITIPIYVYTPNIYVTSKEMHLEVEAISSSLKFTCESELNKLGYTTTTNKDEAELFMHIESNSYKSKVEKEEANTVILNYTINVVDKFDNKVFQNEVKKIRAKEKGITLANTKAYELAQEKIRSNSIPLFADEFIK